MSNLKFSQFSENRKFKIDFHRGKMLRKQKSGSTAAGAHKPILISLWGQAKTLHQRAPKARVGHGSPNYLLYRLSYGRSGFSYFAQTVGHMKLK